MYKAATKADYVPGDVALFVGNGVSSTETLICDVASQGSISGYVTFKAETPRGVTLNWGSTQANQPKIRTTAKQYIWIEGFKITQTARGSGAGDRMVSFWWDGSFNGSHYCVLKNCEVYECIQPVKTQAGQYVTYDGCTFRDMGWGASFFACNNSQMVNCDFYNFKADAVQTKGGCKNIRIGRCLFRVTLNSTGGNGYDDKDAVVYLGGSSAGATTGTTLDPANTGVTDNTGWDGEKVVIYSSIIFQEGSGQAPYAILFMSAKDCAAINCTINANASGGISTVFAFRTSSNTGWINPESGGMPRAKNPLIANCVVYAPGGVGFEQATGAKYDGTLTDRNNTIYSVSSGSAPVSGSSPTTGTATTTNKLTSDPLFKTRASTFAASNLRLQDASPSKATGNTETFLDTAGLTIGSTGNPYPGNLSGVNRDYTGVLRTGTWDRGAYADTVPEPPTGKSDYLEAALLDLIFSAVALTLGADLYFSIHNGDPADTGANEISLAGYARKAITRNLTNFPAAITAGVVKQKTNAVTIQFDTTTAGGTATHIGIWDALTGGNFLYGGPIVGAPITITSGTAIVIPVGSYSATEG